MDLVVQKATELGVERIVPIASERSVAQIEEGSNKLEKWRATSVEAIKQCGSPWLPRIDPPQPAQRFLASNERYDLMLVASLQPDTRHPRVCFQSFVAEHQRLPNSVCIWVGPEGDFTPAEVSTIRKAGALPITLGRLILRSETAVNYELQATG
jgi:16S rRNA (uracil1498-N3)-methyltransferase